jgi:carboxyl-terminal processing protease
MMNKKIVVFLVCFFTIVVYTAWDEDIWTQSINKLSFIISLIEDHYYQDVDSEKLAFSSINGMMKTLDPHSNFLDPQLYSRLTEDYKGKYFGLGILIQKQEERLVVITPIEGTPAYRLGIRAGDIISNIEGESTKPISSYEAMLKLRGLKGTKVTITIIRDGLEKPIELTIKREEIALHSVPYAFMLEDNIGYIYIRNFAGTTVDEFRDKMKFLKDLGMQRLILDMRSNGGGIFAQALELSDEFLPKGSLIVSIKGRRDYYNRKFFAERDEQSEDIPLVILINQGSASAPEIVSGAVMDNDRGLIVGEDSWGKGLVQTVFPLADNAALSLTTAKYFTPSGRSIQRDYSDVDDYYLYSKKVPENEREIKFTAKGRKVMGQGGISPDYNVQFRYQDITWGLLLKGAYFEYGRRFADKKTALSQKYVFPDEMRGRAKDRGHKLVIDRTFTIDSSVLQDFRAFLKERGIKFDHDELDKAKEEISRELQREIFSSIWGLEEGMKVFRERDPVVLKAIEVFPEAKALMDEPVK